MPRGTSSVLADVGGEILLISQFTLYANCKKGNRPSFFNAGEPQMAESLYEYIIEKTKENVPVVKTGRFGALMQAFPCHPGDLLPLYWMKVHLRKGENMRNKRLVKTAVCGAILSASLMVSQQNINAAQEGSALSSEAKKMKPHKIFLNPIMSKCSSK